MKHYRAAVIGLGRMGSTFDDEIEQGGSIVLPYCHAPTYCAHPHIELVGGADPHEEQRTLFGERWAISNHLYADHREMLAQEKPDIVSIATTARVRAQILLDAVAAGVKGIWAEKPLALSLAEADEMVRVCRENGVALAVNCARRYHASFSETRRMIEKGDLGELLQITAYTQCGLSHNGSHAIDTIRYLAGGDVSWVFGEMESDEKAASDDDLMGNGYLAFDNGVRAFMRGMRTGTAAWEFDIIGTEKRVRTSPNAVEFELLQNVPGGPRGRGISARSPFPPPARPQGMGITIVDDLISAIEKGHAPRCSGEDALKALEIAIALRESHRQGGRRISLPMTDRSLKILSSEIHADHMPVRVRRLQST
jgi:predicted dehydrogenase